MSAQCYFAAAMLAIIAVCVLCELALFIGRIITWCDDSRWQHPMHGDRFMDGAP